MSNVTGMPEPRRRRTVNRREPAKVIEIGPKTNDRARATYEHKMRTIASRIEELLDEVDRITAAEDDRLEHNTALRAGIGE